MCIFVHYFVTLNAVERQTCVLFIDNEDSVFCKKERMVRTCCCFAQVSESVA